MEPQQKIFAVRHLEIFSKSTPIKILLALFHRFQTHVPQRDNTDSIKIAISKLLFNKHSFKAQPYCVCIKVHYENVVKYYKNYNGKNVVREQNSLHLLLKSVHPFLATEIKGDVKFE